MTYIILVYLFLSEMKFFSTNVDNPEKALKIAGNNPHVKNPKSFSTGLLLNIYIPL